MTPTAQRLVKVGVVAAILALAAYWYWSPWLAIHQMRSAARAGDADAFSERVDYPRLRESLKVQLAAAADARLGQSSESGSDIARAGAAFGSLLATALVDRMVDALVRPESVMRVMQEGKLMPARSGRSRDRGDPAPDNQGQSDGTPPGEKLDPIWSTEHQGVNTFVLYARRAGLAEDRRTALVFERRGFASWQLTEIRLPAL